MLIDITQEQFAQLTTPAVSAILVYRDDNKLALQGQYPNPPFEVTMNDENRAYLKTLSVPSTIKFSMKDGVVFIDTPAPAVKQKRSTGARSSGFGSGSATLPITR